MNTTILALCFSVLLLLSYCSCATNAPGTKTIKGQVIAILIRQNNNTFEVLVSDKASALPGPLEDGSNYSSQWNAKKTLLASSTKAFQYYYALIQDQGDYTYPEFHWTEIMPKMKLFADDAEHVFEALEMIKRSSS